MWLVAVVRTVNVAVASGRPIERRETVSVVRLPSGVSETISSPSASKCMGVRAPSAFVTVAVEGKHGLSSLSVDDGGEGGGGGGGLGDGDMAVPGGSGDDEGGGGGVTPPGRKPGVVVAPGTLERVTGSKHGHHCW